MSPSKADQKKADEAAEETAESIDQVRDILFGAQMRTVDRRLSQLEERMQRELEAARKDLSKQIADLDGRAMKQDEALSEKLKAESAKRSEDLKALRADMNKGFKDLDKSLGKLDDATAKADAELRDQLLALGETLKADLQAVNESLTADVNQYVDELRSEKTDIASLVELYTDMARRLADILEGPKEEK